MKLYLQAGYGMMSLNERLARRWVGCTAILSPRDLSEAQLAKHATALRALNASVMVDPQFYDPRSDHKRLTGHGHWPAAYTTDLGDEVSFIDDLLAGVDRLNALVRSNVIILPGQYCAKVDMRWIARHRLIATRAAGAFSNKPRLATICLSGGVVNDEDQIHDLLDDAASWPVDGFYVVAEHVSGNYFCDDPIWMTNLMDLCAGLKLLEKHVIVGYANQQLLALACANVDAVAVGNFKNVRRFQLDKFREKERDGGTRRVRYYCPSALSEFRVPYLDVAKSAGLLAEMQPSSDDDLIDSSPLFSAARPSSAQFPEDVSFMHYLSCLRRQIIGLDDVSFDSSQKSVSALFMSAGKLLNDLHSSGVYGEERDFGDVLMACRSALIGHEDRRGFVLRRKWVS